MYIFIYDNVLEGHYQLILIIMQLYIRVLVQGTPEHKDITVPEDRLVTYNQVISVEYEVVYRISFSIS